MSKQDITQQLIQTIDELSDLNALQGIFHEHRDGDPLPCSHVPFFSLAFLVGRLLIVRRLNTRSA